MGYEGRTVRTRVQKVVLKLSLRRVLGRTGMQLQSKQVGSLEEWDHSLPQSVEIQQLFPAAVVHDVFLPF